MGPGLGLGPGLLRFCRVLTQINFSRVGSFNYFGKMNLRSDELEPQSLPTFSIEIILFQFNSNISLGLISSERGYSKGLAHAKVGKVLGQSWVYKRSEYTDFFGNGYGNKTGFINDDINRKPLPTLFTKWSLTLRYRGSSSFILVTAM